MASDGVVKRGDALLPENARDAAMAQEAFRLRGQGKPYAEIAEILGLKKGWTEAYKIVARGYGQAVADQDKERLRMQEAGRLMYMRAMLEDRVKSGDDKAMEMDLKYTAEIVSILGLKDGVVSGSGGGVAVQVINSIPPWERGGVDAGAQNGDGPAPDIVEGEAVEEAQVEEAD